MLTMTSNAVSRRCVSKSLNCHKKGSLDHCTACSAASSSVNALSTPSISANTSSMLRCPFTCMHTTKCTAFTCTCKAIKSGNHFNEGYFATISTHVSTCHHPFVTL